MKKQKKELEKEILERKLYSGKLLKYGIKKAYEKGYKEASKKKDEEFLKDIKTARGCLDFKMIRCKNKKCINLFCPLNKKYEKQNKKS